MTNNLDNSYLDFIKDLKRWYMRKFYIDTKIV